MNFLRHRVLFRADGNSKIGLGHVMRCISLSEMVSKQYECIFITEKSSDMLDELIKPYGKLIALETDDIERQFMLLKDIVLTTDIIVADGYDFDYEYQKMLKSLAKKLIVIDDLAIENFCADVVINHGNKSLATKYKVDANTEVLTGFDYVILRKEFLEKAKHTRRMHKVDTAFICMGGADPSNATLRVMTAALDMAFIKCIIVVLGGAYAHREKLDEIILNDAQGKITIKENIAAAEMIELIALSDICIVPSSSISLEVCCVKSGMLTGTTVDNQKYIHEQLMDYKCAFSVGDFNSVSIEELRNHLVHMSSIEVVQKMSDNQALAIDGNSKERILNEINLMAAC